MVLTLKKLALELPLSAIENIHIFFCIFAIIYLTFQKSESSFNNLKFNSYYEQNSIN